MAKKSYLRKDTYYRKAKEAGFKSRAAFKLVEIDKKFRLFRSGMQVVDLGCSPGSWLQVIANEIGPSGYVVGVDVEETATPLKNVSFIKGDIREERTKQVLLSALGRKVDLVLSDMSPHLSGIKFQDHYNSYELAEQAFKVCHMLLKREGSLVVKIFPGEELESFRQNLKACFPRVVLYTPNATRKSSTETYIIAKGFRPSGNGSGA